MLKNISPLVSPELIKVLMEMGHGDRLVIADANFPAASLANKLIRADGISGEEILNAIVQLIPLDTYSDFAVTFMQHGPEVGTPSVWNKYKNIIEKNNEVFTVENIERFDFYEEASKSYAIVATGEKQLYANIILTKGVL